ncbi:hypothetical protein ACPWME_02295 [Pandoraea pneumonica]
MKQLQERDLRDLSVQDVKLAAQRDALNRQCDAIAGLIESSRLSQVQMSLTELRRELRNGALLRQQARELDVRAKSLDEARDELAAQRERCEALRRRWWRKETTYTRMTVALRKAALLRIEQREVTEFEERLAWIAL